MLYERRHEREGEKNSKSTLGGMYHSDMIPKSPKEKRQENIVVRPNFNFRSLLAIPQTSPPIQAKTEESLATESVKKEVTVNEPIIQEKSEEKPNLTGLPDNLKAGVENLSGYSLDDVRVHYNSPKPAQLQALAYTQGTEIHVAPGQEEHLPHEAWHVVQQMQGRVKPTMQMKGVQINDDEGLEREADVMRHLIIQKKYDSLEHRNNCQCSSCQPVQQKTDQERIPPICEELIPSQWLKTRISDVLQRACGVPGCTDPDCHNEQNHGFNRVHRLRGGRTVYYGEIDQTHIGTGTGTTASTRAYVNAPGTNYPQEVAFSYQGQSASGHSEFENFPLASDQRADAGHIFGNQFGGFGNQAASVFPQHPQTNRGNTFMGQPTRHLWREQEDQVRRMAEGGETVGVSVILREQSRGRYDRSCWHCNQINLSTNTVCCNCGQIL